MKPHFFTLAAMILAVPLYAQTESGELSRQDVLEIFTQFNPSVLEQARQDESYRDIWEQFLEKYHVSDTPTNRWDLIALARNFDNSLRLNTATNIYQQLWLSAKLSGQDISTARQVFRQDVTSVMAQVWAVTVCLREYQLDQTKEAQRALSQTDLSAEQRAEQKTAYANEIQRLRTEIKSLKKNPGERVLAAANQYISDVEKQLLQANFQTRAAAQQTQEAHQTANLQVKHKNKKPVAK